MKIKLLQHNSLKEEIGWLAAATCVNSNSCSAANLKAALSSNHLSILEHITFTFLISDVSRALTHQLIRHRIASYSQCSQRYARVNTDTNWYITPKSFYDCNLDNEYAQLMVNISNFYNKMLEKGIPKEDARYVLPNACKTNLIMTVNARAFIEQAKQRLCNRAQWEIRNLYEKMCKEVVILYPCLKPFLYPPCLIDKCKEKHPCKNPPVKKINI